MKNEDLKNVFSILLNKYSNKKYLNSDPILFPYRYKQKKDIELIGFISSLFSYGNVKSIQNYLNNLFIFFGEYPSEFISQKKNIIKIKDRIKPYRFQTSEDIFHFLIILAEIFSKTNSLEPFWIENSSLNLQGNITNFQIFFKDKIILNNYNFTNGLKFLVGSGNKNSPNKRYYMFLRWMVRNKFPDFGFYKKIKPDKLFYPLDTHISKITKLIGFHNKNSLNWELTNRITSYFKTIFPQDPLCMDFPLSRLGILKECKTQFIPNTCFKCELKKHCLIYNKAQS